jgi:Ca2+/Na+ antiporter
MNSSFDHLLHAIILGVLLYFVMVFILKQSYSVAQDRSMLLAALAFIYMLLFGHSLPKSINRNILS